jgi:hypothetical protein
MAALVLTGCPPSSNTVRSLRSSERVGPFIRDVADGKNLDGWQLAKDADVAASTAWMHKQTIKDLGDELRTNGRTWGCALAKAAKSAVSTPTAPQLELIPARQSEIVAKARGQGASEDQALGVIHRLLTLSPLEASEAVTNVCKAMERLGEL